MSAPFVFHCLNIKLADELLKTCNEYLGYVRRPFQSVPLCQLWKCNQSNWAAAYTEWGVLQFYMGVVTAIIMAVLRGLDWNNRHNDEHGKHHGEHHEDYNAAVIINIGIDVVVRILVCYILAHLSWFAVVRKNGCFCCIIACCECPPVLLLWGVLSIVWGIIGMLDSVQDLHDCIICIIGTIVQAFYCIILLYMGLCCLKLWIQHGSEIIPPVIQGKGPDGEVVGAAVIL